MKILIVSQLFYPEQFRINDICFELVKGGHEVTVLTGLPNYPSGIVESEYRWFKKRKEVINGVKVYRSWLIARRKGKLRLSLNYLSFALAASIKALSLKKDFDLILVYQVSPVTMAIPAILLKKITKKPLIIYTFDLWPESVASVGISNKGMVYKILYYLSKWIYKQADEIFISSKLFKEYFESYLRIKKKLTYLPVYAEDLFNNILPKAKEKDGVHLVFAGNIGHMQSVETIIYAANELKQAKNIYWHIVGDGSAKEENEDLAKRLELKNVIFHGKYPLSEMPRFYELADAFLVTMKENKFVSYTLPGKVQSYMAAGKPIIGAINGETQFVIDEAECGLYSRAEDYKALAENIIKFSSEKHNHSIYGRNAREYYEQNFSKGNFMIRLNRLLELIRKEDGNNV